MASSSTRFKYVEPIRDERSIPGHCGCTSGRSTARSANEARHPALAIHIPERAARDDTVLGGEFT
jgi:hypothetical protein